VARMHLSIVCSDDGRFAVARDDHAFPVVTEPGTGVLAPFDRIFFDAPALLICQSSISHQLSVPCQLSKRCSWLF
jgi:hypothetical protein